MERLLKVPGWFFVILSVFLLGCVTTTDAPKKTVDKKSAVEDYVRLGMNYLNKGSRDSAIGAFSRAVKMDKNSAEAHQGLALVHQQNGEMDLAEKAFKRALRGRADFSMSGVKNSYGRFLLEQGRIKQALNYFEQAGGDLQYRGRATSMLMVGRCAIMLGDKARARGAFEYALNLNPRLAPASLELADMYFAEGKYADAKKYLDQFSASSRQVPRSLWLGIRIERIFGNKDKEASYALSLKNLHPYSQEYLEYSKNQQAEKR